MKGSTTALAIALLMAGLLLMSGCIYLAEDGEVEELPTRGYGTLKLKIDDVGPATEVNEGGVPTGRMGFRVDFDHDGRRDYFYQIRRPSAGVIALSFGDDNYANGALPAGMTRMVPGQEDYEIPLDSLTTWVARPRILGYRPAQIVDDPNTLVYLDRIFDREVEAPMTGNHMTEKFRFVSLGALDVSEKANQVDDVEEPIADDPFADDEFIDEDPDFTPADFGDTDTRCGGWTKICEKLDSCGEWGAEWTLEECTHMLYFFTKVPAGQRYLRCINDELNPARQDCDTFLEKRQACWDEQFADAFACDGEYGPEAADIILMVERDGTVFEVPSGYTVQAGEKLAVFIDYRDVEGDFTNGELAVRGVKEKLTIPLKLGRNGFEDRTYVGFTVANPLPAGEYNLVVTLTDNVDVCGKPGVPFPVTFNSAGTQVADAEEVNPGQRAIEFYEVFTDHIDRHNTGEGFIDVRVINTKGEGEYSFLYQFTDFDVAFIQAYFWSFVGIDSFDTMDIDTLNRAIFTTTADDRDTKYDGTDDIQAYAFYIDQPMGSGLFSFYGDEGWNIYPKAPSGDNEDQPFIRGDLEETQIHVPFVPFYDVDPRYTGCGNLCDHWVNTAYDEGLSMPGFSPGDAGRADALDNCLANSGSHYWMGAMTCIKQANDGDNGCTPLGGCLDQIGGPPQGGKRLCQTNDPVPLNIRITFPEKYLADPEYRALLINDRTDPDWQPLVVGLFAQMTVGGQIVPGASVEINYPQEQYELLLPYMPHVPGTFFQIAQAESSIQSQLQVGILDPRDGAVLGGGYYEPDALYEDDEWYWLPLYSYNWTGVTMQGWSLGVVSGNTIYEMVNPYEQVIALTFGDLRSVGEGYLK